MYYLVVDIGGTTIKYGIADQNAKIYEKGSFLTSRTDREYLINNFKEIIARYNDQYKIAGMALSCPGLVDSKTGYVEFAGAIECLHKTNIKELLEANLGLRVELENDAACAALAEVWQGSAKDVDNSVFLVLGTGIGGAVVKDRKIHSGKHFAAGEFGLTILAANHETEEIKYWHHTGGSTIVMVNRVNERRKKLNLEEIDGARILELYQEGDSICKEEVDKFLFYLACGIYNIQLTYDPEMIVIGGGISQSEVILDLINKMYDRLVKEKKFFNIYPTVKKCHFGADANLVGALYNFIDMKR